MNTEQLRKLLRAISGLAWLPHTAADQGPVLDPERDPNLLVALGKIAGIAEAALTDDERR